MILVHVVVGRSIRSVVARGKSNPGIRLFFIKQDPS